MKNHWLFPAAVCVCACSFASGCGAKPPVAMPAEQAKEVQFVPVKIDGPVHNPSKHTYWWGPFAECSSVLDINGDGKLDIAAGRNYYLAPNLTKSRITAKAPPPTGRISTTTSRAPSM